MVRRLRVLVLSLLACACPALTAGVPNAGASACTITVTAKMRIVRGTSHADVICVISGRSHEIHGRGGADVIWDSAASDLIYGGGGADVVHAGRGDDTVYGGGGSDQIFGDGGDDTIDGGAGANRLSGGADGDVLSGGDDGDVISGGPGDDTISGGGGADSLSGDDGADAIDAGTGDDYVSGGPGADTLDLGDGNDTGTGDIGDDAIHGGDGSDQIAGGNDEDQLSGDNGDDHLLGGSGDDDLTGGPGSNTCDGGGGNDHLDPTCDSTAPRLLSLSLSATSVDTSSGPVQVIATARFADDLSGFDNAGIGVGTIGASWQQSDRIAGDDMNGVYRTTIYLPRYMQAGTWPIGVIAKDRVGNWKSVTTEQLQQIDAPLEFSQTGPGDDTAPTVTNLTLSSTSLDSSTGPAAITATVHAEDDLSGFHWLTVLLTGPAGRTAELYFDGFQRISGTATSGDYPGELDLPKYSPAGAWHVTLARVGDNAGNVHTLSDGELRALMGGVDTITETGPGDIAGPQYDSFTAVSDGADPATGDVHVTLDIHLWDDLAGVAHADCTLRSPSGVIRDAYISPASRISGDAMDGAYEVDVTIPQYSYPGQWAVRCHPVDAANNATDTLPITVQIG